MVLLFVRFVQNWDARQLFRLLPGFQKVADQGGWLMYERALEGGTVQLAHPSGMELYPLAVWLKLPQPLPLSMVSKEPPGEAALYLLSELLRIPVQLPPPAPETPVLFEDPSFDGAWRWLHQPGQAKMLWEARLLLTASLRDQWRSMLATLKMPMCILPEGVLVCMPDTALKPYEVQDLLRILELKLRLAFNLQEALRPAEALLKRFGEEPMAGVRYHLLEALQNPALDGEVRKALLFKAFADSDVGVRLRALALRGEVPGPPLQELLKNARGEVLLPLVKRLAGHKRPEELVVLRTLVARLDVGADVAEILAEVKDTEAVPAIARALNQVSDERQVLRYARALETLADVRASAALARWLNLAGEPEAQQALLNALRVCADARARGPLYSFVQHARGGTRKDGEALLNELVQRFGPLELGALSLTEPGDEGQLSLAEPERKGELSLAQTQDAPRNEKGS